LKHFTRLSALASAVALAVALGAPAVRAADEPPAAEHPMPSANWLFVQVADSFTSDGKTLTLKGVAPQTLMFSDRPQRMTGDVKTAKFVAYWLEGKTDFEKDPPNATVSTVVDGKPSLTVVELKSPKLEGDTLTYEIKALDGELPAAGQEASLFIDWWYGPGWGPRWRPGWGPGPGPWPGGGCRVGPWGGWHCRPYWGW